MQLQLVLAASMLAIAYCAPPGPVLAEATRRGLRSGFRPALAVQLGSLVGDALWVSLALAGAASLAQAQNLQTALGVAGSVLLMGLGLRALYRPRKAKLSGLETPGREGALATGAALAVASPFALPFWLGVGASLPSFGIGSPSTLDYLVFFTSFMIACLAYAIFAAGAIAWGRNLLQQRFFFAIDLVCGVVLLVFGAQMLVTTLTRAVS